MGYHKAKMEWQVKIHLAHPQYVMEVMVTITLLLQGISKLMKKTLMPCYFTHYSGWDFPEYPFLFHNPNHAACWAISRFKRDGFGNVWGQGKYPPFLRFVGQVKMRRSDVEVLLESPLIIKSKIEHRFFSQFIFHLPKKDSILLSSDYVQLSKETFDRCTGSFCNKEPNYQQSSRSIYRDEDGF
jgi:hypothetical protein